MSIHSLLSKAKQIFILPEDQATLNQLDNRTRELENIKDLMQSEGGKSIKKMLVDDFFFALDNLFKTREDQYTSDLKSVMDLIKKLSVDQEIDQIRVYLEDKLK